MANPEHLKILQKGIKDWKKWRRENRHIKPDLSGADFTGVNLNGVDLRGADLRRADLRDAQLSESDLSEANLRKADLDRADLSGADFSAADLSEANLVEAYLSDARLTGTSLSNVRFTGAVLTGVELQRADLSDANLNSTRMEKSDLRDADLKHCNLVGANMSRAILTGAKLFGTARDNWVIKGVECKYIYWDKEGVQRSPKDRDFEPGEFERIYSALPTIEYVFEKGMSPIDPLIMDRVVQAIREKLPEFDINLESIEARGLKPSIKFTVQHEDHKDSALEEVRKGYEERLKQVEADKDRLYDLFTLALENIKYKDRLLEQKDKMLSKVVGKVGDTIITGPDSLVVSRSPNAKVQQYNYYARELQKAITEEPEESESFAKIAKKTALDIVGNAIKDIAKGQIKEAAKQIIELGKDLGPLLVRMAPAAYEFFRNIGG